MNNDIIIQTMTESFEALKDSWETKKEAIIKCIVETEACDGALAMDMWGYVLKKNEALLKDKNENVNFIDNVILGFRDKYKGASTSGSDFCETMLNHVAPHFVRNENLIKIVFGLLINAGYSNKEYYYFSTPSELLPALIACLFLQDYPPSIPVIIKSLAQNKNMDDVSIGNLILKSNTYIDGVEKQWTWIERKFYISDQVKESLLNCLDLIKDKEDRAEIALSLMAR